MPEADPAESKQAIYDSMTKLDYQDTYTNISIDTNKTLGPGPGFTGVELLSKDELNIILDLEDEQRRLGHF